jgi:transposase-like protein
VKVCDEGSVKNKPIYLALGFRRHGTRDVIEVWIEQTEGAKFRLSEANDPKLRCAQEVMFGLVDGPKGFPSGEAALKLICRAHRATSLLNGAHIDVFRKMR